MFARYCGVEMSVAMRFLNEDEDRVEGCENWASPTVKPAWPRRRGPAAQVLGCAVKTGTGRTPSLFDPDVRSLRRTGRAAAMFPEAKIFRLPRRGRPGGSF